MSGLRFAMVTTFYPPYHFGGDAVFIRRLSHALARRGHEVEVIHDVDAFELLHRGPPPAPLEEAPGVRTHPLRSRVGALSCLLTQQVGRPVVHGAQIRRILDEGRFDVVHFHNVSLVGGPGVLSCGSGIKLYTAHEHWLVCPTHVLWRYGRELCDAPKCLRCSLVQHRPPQLWRHTGLLADAARHIDVFISPSAFSADKHREWGFPRALEVMPYFLPDDADADGDAANEDADEARTSGAGPPPAAAASAPDSATGASRDAARRSPYFLFVGRLEKIKGLQDVIPHFGSDAPADLLVVGTGEHEGALRALAANSPRVHFLGRRSPQQLRPLYRAALATLVPSLCYETFGIVMLESFREGTPVIARRLGPLREVIESSGGGLLFDDAAGLAEALRRTSADPTLRQRLGRAGRQALRQRWVESVVIEQYFGIIHRVAQSRGRSRVVEALRAHAPPEAP